MTTEEAIALAQEKTILAPVQCNNCLTGFYLKDLKCAQPDDLARCPECNSTEVRLSP
jgi:predicted Zn finger-like uncharacterized protein